METEITGRHAKKWPPDVSIHVAAIDIKQRDAVGNFCLQVFKYFTRQKIRCRLFAENVDHELKDIVAPLFHLERFTSEKDILFYNFSTFDPFLERAGRMHCRKALYFHNITPPELLPEEAGNYVRKAFRQFCFLSKFNLLFANSYFSRTELIEQIDLLKMNISEVYVFPPIIWQEKGDSGPDEFFNLPATKRIFLYVGRISPHKGIEDVLRIFSQFLKFESDSALCLVGKPMEDYGQFLGNLLDGELWEIKQKVFFLNSLSDGQIRTVYKRSSLFITMSRHEGFCVPLIEAMQFGLPIFAFNAAAVGETLGNAGILFNTREHYSIAEKIYRVLNDNAILKEMNRAAQKRLIEIAEQADGARMRNILINNLL